MGYVILLAVSLVMALASADPNLLQGRPHGISGSRGGSFHHAMGEVVPHGGDDHLLAHSGQSFQEGINHLGGFNRGTFPVGGLDRSSFLGQDNVKQLFQGSTGGPIILGQSGQRGGQGGDRGAFLLDQGGQQRFLGLQNMIGGGIQTGQNNFADRNVFGAGQQQRFGGDVTVTRTIDHYITTTDLAFNSLPVTFTNFNKHIVTRTTRQILATPVNDVVHVTTAVVRSISTLAVTHVNTVINFVTQTTVELYPVTHTAYEILQSTYTSVVTQREVVTSTIVHTNIATDTITVTDRRYITDYHYVTARYY